jgi:hypothetical protein
MEPNRTTRTLTDEQLDTLIEYANFVGRRWKDALSLDWYRASAYESGFPGIYSHLQAVRNWHGTEWLFHKTTTLPSLVAEQERRKAAAA